MKIKLTPKQQKDLETIKYFIPKVCRNTTITDEDIEMFFGYSDKGLHKDKKGDWVRGFRDGFNALCEGKRWRGIHMHEMWEQGILDGSVSYITLLGGYEIMRETKWWNKWWYKLTDQLIYHKPIPRSVVDFMKKEMFQGKDSKRIEDIYRLLKDN